MKSQFVGTGVAVVTPFNDDNTVDYDSLTKIINHLIDNGIEYLVCQGSTGEKLTLTAQEQVGVASHFVKINAGRLPLVFGLGGSDTAKVVEALKSTNLEGFDAILSATPSYNKPSQEGLYHHFKAIAEESPLPIILYNVPSRTAVNMLPKTVVRLARDFDNIIAVKEAAGSMVQALELIRTVPEDFLVLSGDDMMSLPMTLAGGAGVISVMGQGLPRRFSDMIRLGLEGKAKAANNILYDIMPCIDYIFEEGNPTGIKALLALQGLCKNNLRLPLISSSTTLDGKLKQYV